MDDFLITKDQIYLDSACQSLRPQSVVAAMAEYYNQHNSCGERVRYQWGIITDQKVSATRDHILKFLKLKPKYYFVSFTLNTTYGLNLILNSLKPEFDQIITSDLEHNSVFLSTIKFSQKHQIPRHIINREIDGSINLDNDFRNALVVVNSASNIDGRLLTNLKALTKKVHQSGGIVIIDAAQTIAHSSEILHQTEADAICFSGHKAYAPSIGVMVIKKSLLDLIDPTFIGGGMVDNVTADDYQLSFHNKNHIHTIFEPGLQLYAEIIGLETALTWLEQLPKSAKLNLEQLGNQLFDFLSTHPKIKLINQKPSTTFSLYFEGLNSHLLASALADEQIMARSGYFCAHYYLNQIKKYPPLIRFSLGYHTRSSDIETLISKLGKI